jgi:dienelactone hydrolase
MAGAATAIVAAAAIAIVIASREPAPAGGDEALTLSSRDATLAATLVLPETGRRPWPAVVMVHGSGRMTAADMIGGVGRRLLSMGVAVLAYDKRGVGGSTGEYTGIGPANSVRMFDLLASDALAGVQALAGRRDIDATRIGLVGISQGGWIAPLAASRDPRVNFVITISGPAVTVGEEIAYSQLAGDDPGSIQGLADAEIDRRMAAFTGPHGYDPAPILASMRAPSFWVLGERDRSIPLRQTVAALTRLRDAGRPITLHVMPGVNHGMRDPGTGRAADMWEPITRWLQLRKIL